LDAVIVGSGDVGETTSSPRLAFLNLGPPSLPHGHMCFNLWFAVPGHDGMLTGANLRLAKSSGREWISTRTSPPREQDLRE